MIFSRLKILPLIIALCFFTTASFSQSVNYRNFDYSGVVGNVGGAKWRPTAGSYDYVSPGLYFAFYGEPDPAAGCGNYVSNGATINNLYWPQLYQDTGISSGGVGAGFSPHSNIPDCIKKDRVGFTYAHYKNFTDSNSIKGLGLLSYTGPTPVDTSLGFFQPDVTNIQGNFASFINCSSAIGCSGANVPRPFSGTSSNFDLLRVAFVTMQGLSRLSLESPSTQQAKQQVVVSFRSLVPGQYGSVQYLLVTAVAGKNANLAPTVQFDPFQTGIPYFGGKLGSAGQTQVIRDSKNVALPVWTSWAEASTSTTWTGQKKFQSEISFSQFLNVLKLAASKKYGGDTSKVLSSDLIYYFGSNYNQPLNWVISQQGLAHEIFNENWTTKRALIGGNASELKVISLPY